LLTASSFEVVAGFPVSGPVPGVDAPPSGPDDPYGVLLSLMSAAPGPVAVEFSGGCDSSLVLAAGVEAARRSGRELPIPVTLRYPSLPEADETPWQELVLDALGVRDRIVITVEGDEDLLGPRAIASLAHRGLIWPPAAHAMSLVLDAVKGATLFTGHGGDEVLGPRRITPTVRLLQGLRHSRGPSRSDLGVIADAVRLQSPAFRVQQMTKAGGFEWLIVDARAAVARRLTAVEPVEPWQPSRGVVAASRTVAQRRMKATFESLGEEMDVRWRAPLLEPSFVAAVAGATPLHRFRGRSTILATHFAHVLPEKLLWRQNKAWFNRAFFGEETRSFARSWDGEGLPSFIDADWLKANWLSDLPHAGTALLLHAAFLIANGTPVDLSDALLPLRSLASVPAADEAPERGPSGRLRR